MENPAVQLVFAANYQIEIDPDLTNLDALFYFPPDSATNGLIALQIRLCHDSGHSFVARFERGSLTRFNLVSSSPNPDVVAVLSGGGLFLVDVLRPQAGTEFIAPDIVDLLPFVDRDLLVAVSYTDFTAIGPSGVGWRTGRVSLDGISDIYRVGDDLCASVIDPATGQEAKVKVCLSSGRATGLI